MKITEDFIGNETKELTKTKIATILRWWGFNPDSYSTWGNARVDMNNILSGSSSSTISDRERASSFLSKINYINDTDTVISDTLFAANEPGVWYDPSDLSTLFQDAAGTTPVTAVEQPVGLMLDKSKGLVLGPELVTNGDFRNGATGWTAGAVAPSSVTFSSGSVTMYRDAASSDPAIVNIGEGVLGKVYLITFDVLSVTDQTKNIGVRFGQTGTIYPLSMIGPPGKKRFIVTANGSGLIAIRHGGSGPSTIVLDNISVRELPGNHASQPTATSRPVLSARVNLLEKTENLADGYWGVMGTVVRTPNAGTAPDGTISATRITASTTGFNVVLRDVVLAAVPHDVGVWVKSATSSSYPMRLWLDGTALSILTTFTATPEWQLVKVSGTPDTSARIQIGPSTSGNTYDVLVWGADLRVANDGANLPPYQRVNTATDYDTVGFPHYLRFDGVDDWLVTPTITPGTDKVQVFAGVRKLSDAVSGAICELSANLNNNNGTAALFWDSVGRWAVSSKGTLRSNAVFPEAGPLTRVLTGLAGIAGDSTTLRVNGTQVASSTEDQGTGNYLAYPLYIGRRGGTTLPFNGHIYGLIVRFGSNLPTATIEKTEKYINGLTKAY